MSDFVQTMKDWSRMCKTVGDKSCERCKLYIDGEACIAIYDGEMDYAKVEQTVTAWAAEHPEPVYPTWGEYLVSIKALYERWDNHVNDYDIAEYAINAMRKPIPADIAEKLGIEPKKG